MTIHAIGNDVVEIDRIEQAHARRGQRLLDLVFTPDEQAWCEACKHSYAHYAGRWAVKEAVMKVLGTGWSGGVRWVDIETRRVAGQPPELVLHGRTAEIAAELGIALIHITISHDAGIASAVAVAER